MNVTLIEATPVPGTALLRDGPRTARLRIFRAASFCPPAAAARNPPNAAGGWGRQ